MIRESPTTQPSKPDGKGGIEGVPLGRQGVQDVLFGILKDFADYCERNGFAYCLAAGTLLGAVRHGGFIPWDDDVDVFMPRADYLRFVEAVRRRPLADRYRAVALELGNSPYPFLKLEDAETKITNSNSSLHTSLWIDVFPLDDLDPNVLTGDGFFRRIRRYGKMLEIASIERCRGRTAIVRIAKAAVVALARIRGAERYGRLILDTVRRHSRPDSPLVGDAVWGSGRSGVLPREVFFPCSTVRFRGVEFKAPGDTHAYLSSIYGDYMKLPPESQRVSHGTEAILLRASAGAGGDADA